MGLLDIFSKKKMDGIKLSKEEIAEFLKTSPEALEAFEHAYDICEIESDNLFDSGVHDAKAMNAHLQNAEEELNDLIDRIVNELLGNTFVMRYVGGKLVNEHYIADKELKPVEPEDVKSLPKELRPQLTGRYMIKDCSGDNGAILLYHYKQYLEEKNPKRKQTYYGMFRQGLDILDLDPLMYEMLGLNRNSMENWFPQLCQGMEKQEFFKIPDTTLIRVPITLLQLTRLQYEMLNPTTLEIVDRYCQNVFGLQEDKEYFVKTGTYSSKFFFRNAHVKGANEVRELGEYLLYIQNQSCTMSGPLCTPVHFYGLNTTNTWVVREYIKDKENNPCIYKGMPLHTEYRVFVDFDTQEILGINPYWDPEVMKKRFGHEEDADNPHNVHDYIIYQMHEETLMKRYHENKDTIMDHIKRMLPDIPLTGQWSIDVMQNGNDFYIIDMALAENSALKECIPKGKLKKAEEYWLPKI